MPGLEFKRNAAETLERRRRFLRREMRDGVLAILPVRTDTEAAWRSFEAKWGTREEGQDRPFPSNEEIFERCEIGLRERGQVDDDWLPVVYSIRDAGEAMVGAMFGMPMRFLHWPRQSAFSKAQTICDYSALPSLRFSLDNPWTRRFLSIQEHFVDKTGSSFAQHPCLTMDALNFAVELRGATEAYTDIYANPDELRALMEIGLDFNIRFQEAQMQRTGRCADGSFVWLAGWAPFPSPIALSVDAYVICSVKTYAEFGWDFQRRLLEHFGDGVMHFHCNRADLAAEVARLPGLRMFQFGGDTRDPLPALARLPEIRRAVGGLPIWVDCSLEDFRSRIEDGTLAPNVLYHVWGDGLSADQANRLMDRVRAYRAKDRC